jgi:hypothetical protein
MELIICTLHPENNQSVSFDNFLFDFINMQMNQIDVTL